MLRRGEDALAAVITLEAADEGDSDGRTQVGVLSVGLLHAAPSSVTSNVEIRRARLVDTKSSHLTPYDVVGCCFDRLRVP